MREKFVVEKGRACLLDIPNIDTDIIIPQTELTTTGRTGLGSGLFANWRYIKGRKENPKFVLNHSANRNAKFLIVAKNFGCGSSREHAVWALRDFGIRAVASTQFGEIFHTNCVRNCVLPAILTDEGYTKLMYVARENCNGVEICIDLRHCMIRADNSEIPFVIDSSDRERLLTGADEIKKSLTYIDTIEDFTRLDKTRRPWIHWTPWTTSTETR